MEYYRFLIDRTMVEIPWWWMDALLLWTGLIGVVLYLFGRHLIRPMFGVLGLALGAAAGALLSFYLWPESQAFPAIAAGALVGALVLWMLYRLSMASVLALVFAIAAPLIVLLLHAQPLPPVFEPITQGLHEIHTAATSADVSVNTQGQPTIRAEDLPNLRQPIAEMIDNVASALSRWWRDDLPSSTAWLIGAATTGGAVLGFLIGLIAPGLTAGLVASFIATLLLIAPVRRLAITASLSQTLLPATPEGAVTLIAVAVVIGALIQWTVFRRGAD